jgi:hypothetical protein
MASATALAITIYLASGLVAGIIAGSVARRKRRNAGIWTVLAFLLPPVVFILPFLPRGDYRPPRPEPEWEDNLDRL